jgi:uncharacterized membrane protein
LLVPIAIGKGEQNPNQQWLGFFVLNSFVMHLVYILYSQKINRFYIGYTAHRLIAMFFNPDFLTQQQFCILKELGNLLIMTQNFSESWTKW